MSMLIPHFPLNFSRDCLKMVFTALEAPNLTMGDAVICNALVYSSMYTIPKVVQDLLNDQTITMEGKSRVLSVMHKHILAKKDLPLLYESVLHYSDIEFLAYVIENKESLANNLCKYASIKNIIRTIRTVSWYYRSTVMTLGHTHERTMRDMANKKSIATYLTSHNMKKIVKYCSGSVIAALYQNSMCVEKFTPAALRKIPASKWYIVLKRDPSKWIYCENIYKLPALSAYSILRTRPQILEAYPNLAEWKLTGSQWKSLIKHNPNVKKYMPEGSDLEITFLVLKRK